MCRTHQSALDLFGAGRDPEWRNRLIWGDKKYVLPSLLDEFAGKVNLIYIDPPFNVGVEIASSCRELRGRPRNDTPSGATCQRNPFHYNYAIPTG